MIEFLQQEINKFLDYQKSIRAQSSIKSYKSVLNSAIKYIEIDNNSINITAYRIQISNQNKKTIAKKISIIRSFVNFLENSGHKFRLIGDETIKVPKSLPKPIQTEKVKEVLKVANLLESTIIYLIYGLGLRISELLDLKISDISNDWITVTGKGSKTRTIPIHPELKKVLANYLSFYPTQNYLFNKENIKMSYSQIRYIIDKAFSKIGIKVTPHQLRHSFATDLLNSGARINDVSELLGHQFLSTTQIYTKLNSNTKLDNYLKAHPLCF
jgi:site-specific recombinase XerD